MTDKNEDSTLSPRERARLTAKKNREQDKKSLRTKKIALWASVALAVGLVITLVIVITGMVKQNTLTASLTSPGNMGTDGIILNSATSNISNGEYTLSDGTPTNSTEQINQNASEEDAAKHHITIYLDYACPHCKTFEDANSTYLRGLLDKGAATIEYKPIAVIGSKLSYTGGNAAACVATYAPNKFLDLHEKLFTLTDTNQNATNSVIKPLIKELGLSDETQSTVFNCMTNNVYQDWLNKATDNIDLVKDADGNALVEGTPTVLIDGIKYPFNTDSFPQFFEELLAQDAANGTDSHDTTGVQSLIDSYSAKLSETTDADTSSTSDSSATTDEQ